MVNKVLVKVMTINLPDLEQPCPIFLLMRETIIPRGPNIDVSKFSPGFMIQMDFSSLNVEIIRGFTSTFVDMCYATLYPFGCGYG